MVQSLHQSGHPGERIAQCLPGPRRPQHYTIADAAYGKMIGAMANDAHAAANAAQLRLLQEELAAALTLSEHPAVTGPTNLTAVEIAGLPPEPYRMEQWESEAAWDLPPAEQDTVWPDVEVTRPGLEERSA